MSRKTLCDGECVVCGGEFAIKKDGTLFRHGWKGSRSLPGYLRRSRPDLRKKQIGGCWGSGMPPIEDERAQEVLRKLIVSVQKSIKRIKHERLKQYQKDKYKELCYRYSELYGEEWDTEKSNGGNNERKIQR